MVGDLPNRPRAVNSYLVLNFGVSPLFQDLHSLMSSSELNIRNISY